MPIVVQCNTHTGQSLLIAINEQRYGPNRKHNDRTRGVTVFKSIM